jgi:pre-mRNA-splicing factor SYF1
MPGQILHPKAMTAATPEATKIDLYLIAEEDIPYEEELIRNPFTLQPWLRYLQHKTDRPLHEKVFVLERACRELPGSYKLWKMYLDLRARHLGTLNPAKYEEEYDKVNDAFERALVLLNKVNRIYTQNSNKNRCREYGSCISHT